MSEAGDQRAIAGWLRRFKWSLGGMPSPEREDLVAEVRAHLDERIAAGVGVTEALNGFGTPEAYARNFVEQMELARALTGGRFPSLLGAVARRVHRSAVAAAAFIAVLLLAGLAGGICVTAAVKLVDPVHAGLWFGEGGLYFGREQEPGRMRELLGPWIFPLAPVSVALAWVLARLVLISSLQAVRSSR
ncbi:MAG TPA: hypothetical protein VF699_03940 [Caulobacteraceae bacterium]|jgi:hypothetical protein